MFLRIDNDLIELCFLRRKEVETKRRLRGNFLGGEDFMNASV